MDDEDKDEFSINGEGEHNKANDNDEYNDGIWSDEAFF
jgi:hypothetical protein